MLQMLALLCPSTTLSCFSTLSGIHSLHGHHDLSDPPFAEEMLQVPPRLSRILLASLERRGFVVTRCGREEGGVAEHVSRKPVLSAGDDGSREFECVVHGYVDSDARERRHQVGCVAEKSYAKTRVS